MTSDKWVELGAGSKVTSEQAKMDWSNNARVNEIFRAKRSSMFKNKGGKKRKN